PGASFAAGVARVDFATGNVAAIAPDGRSRPLAKGAEINVGETVSTQQGRAQLRFADGAYMSLQPQTDFKVEEFKYSGKDEASDGIVMNLLKGGLRTITGLIGRTNRNAYRLKTEVATIGIRGTEYSVRYTNSIEVFVADGAISVENQSGSFVVPGGTGVMVSNQNTPPQQTEQKPVLPPEGPVQQEQEEQTQQPANPVNPIQEAFPAVTQTILTGTITGNWAAAHWDYGTDVEIEQTITLNSNGALLSFADSFEGGGVTTASSGISVASAGNDGIIAWGRWVGGPYGSNSGFAGGNGAFSGADLNDLFGEGPGSGALHYIVGLPATNLPPMGMMGSYSMIGATTPSIAGIVQSASVDKSSSIDVYFGTNTAVLNLGLNINGALVSGSDTLDLQGARMSGSVFISGSSTCGTASVAGFLAGHGGIRAGMAYRFITSGQNGHVIGAIAFKQDAVMAGQPPVQ
ncbi:MAG TPA: FecR family protein, partial [Burkholderiales bacterium]|nr:FecR family protein [Burkholderiales bacterium]